MTWDIFGGLTSVDNGTDSITYTYMGDGQRRSKTVNGVTTTYHYNNGMLLSETTGDETLRYYYDSTGKIAEILYRKGTGKETGYFYARNAQGDIIAIYRSKDSKLMGTYEYDLWGKLICITPTADDTDNITEKNPYRYRSYYYDDETGFYYLKARYYDPEIRRFISADSMNAIMLATTDVGCKNLFAYAENNPVNEKDSSGNFVGTVFDIISLTCSIVELCNNPNDPVAWACAVGDAADLLIPCVSGVGEAIRGTRVTVKAAETSKDINEGVSKAVETVNKSIDIELKYKDSWTEAQRAEADAKVKALSDAVTIKTPVTRSSTSASSKYKSVYGKESVPEGYDVDHTIDLQLGGIDDITNMNSLDMSVNRSLGVQIKNAIKNYPDGTVFGKFTIQ